MTILGLSIAVLVIYLWVFWGLFVLVMGIYRAHLDHRLTTFQTWLGLPWVIIGYTVDVFSNIFIASILFLELPKELLVTSRLSRYINTDGASRRKSIAGYICENILDSFDPTGVHCR